MVVDPFVTRNISLACTVLYLCYLYLPPPTTSCCSCKSYTRMKLLSSQFCTHMIPFLPQGSLELAGLLAHPLLEVLLQLEYLISWSQPATAAGTAPTGSSRRSLQSTTSQVQGSLLLCLLTVVVVHAAVGLTLPSMEKCKGVGLQYNATS